MSKKEPLIHRVPSRQVNDDQVPQSEQDRIIESTGLLQKVKKREAELAAHQPTPSEYVWQAIFLSIPFGFLLSAFDVTVKVQFSEPWNYKGLVLKALKSAPALIPFIYLTNKHKSLRRTQVIMSVGSAVVGVFLLYTVRNSPALGQMMRAPGLATIWVYFIVQLDLIPAMISLLIAAVYWYLWEK